VEHGLSEGLPLLGAMFWQLRPPVFYAEGGQLRAATWLACLQDIIVID